MNKYRILFNNFILALLFIAISSCKKDKEEISNNGNNQPLVIQLDSFPISVGHSWKYYTEAYFIDSNGVIFLPSFYDSYWEIISDTLINGELCSKFSQLDSNYNGSTHLTYTFYTSKPDGFYGMAVENSGSLLHLRTSELIPRSNINLIGCFENNLFTTDTVYVPSPSLKFLRFPSIINDSWLSYEYNNPNPDVVKRKWIGFKTITTNAGTFDCIKLQMYWDHDNNNQPDSGKIIINQYYSHKGLIQEEFNGTVIFGGTIGVATVHRTSKLVQINF